MSTLIGRSLGKNTTVQVRRRSGVHDVRVVQRWVQSGTGAIREGQIFLNAEGAAVLLEVLRQYLTLEQETRRPADAPPPAQDAPSGAIAASPSLVESTPHTSASGANVETTR